MKLNHIYLLVALSVTFFSCSIKLTTTLEKTNPNAKSTSAALSEIKQFQLELNQDYRDAEDSPLGDKQRESFSKSKGHDFYPIDLKYRVVAQLNTKVNQKDIGFETSTERIAMYDLYGIASFNLNGKDHQLYIYKSHYLRDKEEYKNHLFLPFNDLTNGGETYGGGRYIDLLIPENKDEIMIDFNKSYNPYCAYSYDYSCPVPPIENSLNTEIKAGIRHQTDFK